MSAEDFCNDGSRPLSVPGIGSLDSEFQLPAKERFASPFDKSDQLYVTAREWAVLRVINTITDEPDWHQAVLQKDEARIARWQAAAQETASAASPPHLINTMAWTWILRELRDKASSFASNGGVVVYDTGAKGTLSVPLDTAIIWTRGVSGIAVFKSDTVSPNLVDRLEQLTTSIHHRHSHQGQVHPIDPSMFPLVFNRTPVLTHAGETVGLSTAVDTFGKGLIVTPNMKREFDLDKPYLWLHRPVSHLCQWLPCEVQFRGGDDEVEITSYINNLDPTHFRDLYATIEKLIARAIPAWNRVLVKGEHGQYPTRINTFGLDFTPRRNYRDLVWLWAPDLLDEEDVREQAASDVEQWLAQPEPPSRLTADNCGFDHDFDWRLPCGLPTFDRFNDALYHKWLHIRAPDQAKHPEMGQTLSYDDWAAGNTAACVVPPIFCEDTNVSSIPGYSFQKYDVNLQKTFFRKGLQVFITLSSINLTPTATAFEDKEWSIQGFGNEHIVGVALLPYSIDNIAHEPCMRFRCSSRGQSSYDYDNYDLDQLIEIMALDKESRREHNHSNTALTSCQDVGSVLLRRGRLIAWPNHLRFKMGPIQLQDPNTPGHLRYLTLGLVDPHYRICSTRNVAPQQPQYWIDKALAEIKPSSTSPLPPELRDRILEQSESWPISAQDAKSYRDDPRPTSPPFGFEQWAPRPPELF